jgi:VIT1/CCC1 family predicted Fe2+/Mn2+ transporter
VNPDELGSPWTTALSSFVTFALGAPVPLLPWLIAPGPRAGMLSLAVVLASAVTFLVGRLFGVAVS